MIRVDDNTLQLYRTAYEEFDARLQDLLHRRAAGLLHLLTDSPVIGQLAALFPQGVMHT